MASVDGGIAGLATGVVKWRRFGPGVAPIVWVEAAENDYHQGPE